MYIIWKSTADNNWYWRYVASNGKEISRSSEGYWNKQDCMHSIHIMQASSNAPIREA